MPTAAPPKKKRKLVTKRAPPASHLRVISSRGPVPAEDELYGLITQAIINKQILPGGRLKEAALATQFGVSRARVRRVLQRLADLKIIEFRLNFGAMVSRPSPADAAAVFATRRVLEAEAVRLACERACASDVKRMRVFVRRERQAFDGNERGVAALSSGFHLLLGEICGNAVLARLLIELVHQCVLVQTLYERPGQHTVCLVHEHREIIDLIERGKPDAAIAAMNRHLDHIEASLDYSADRQIDARLAVAVG